MRLVMEISGARWIAAVDTKCDGHSYKRSAARIVDGRKAREPVRRNGHKTSQVLGRDSVGWMRKFDSHGYVWALAGQRSYLTGRWLAFFREARTGRVRGGDKTSGIAKGLAERTFCRVCPRFQQAINGLISDDQSAYLIKL
jgi:hypothetical protein